VGVFGDWISWMKVYIKQSKTGRYLKRTDSWTSDQGHALCFKNSLDAIDFILSNKIRGSVILITFGDPIYDIEIRTQEK
jgi:hypothetical protein